jgi:predicted Zn-dependent protease
VSIIENLEALLRGGRDDALLRFSLGSALLGERRPEEAVTHLARAVDHDPEYSAAWKLLGKALAAAGKSTEAADAYTRGIAVAERKGDVQAAREMKVFLKRLRPGDTARHG